MKKITLLLVTLALLLTSCGTELPEKKISLEDHDGATIEYTCVAGAETTEGTIAYKKTEDGYVFYEITDDGTEYVCETAGEALASFVRTPGSEKFAYQEVSFGENSVFEDDAAYYRYNFACYGFDYAKELGELEFKKQADAKVGERDCFVYTAEYDGSEMKISVDKENGLWLSVEDGGVVYTVTDFRFDGDIIPDYK